MTQKESSTEALGAAASEGDIERGLGSPAVDTT
jgi:hypothetical protein